MDSSVVPFIHRVQGLKQDLNSNPYRYELLEDEDDIDDGNLAELERAEFRRNLSGSLINSFHDLENALGEKSNRSTLAKEIAEALSNSNSRVIDDNLVPSLRKLVIFLDSLIKHSMTKQLKSEEESVLVYMVNSVFKFLDEIKNACLKQDEFRKALEYLPFNNMLNYAKQLGLNINVENPLKESIEQIGSVDTRKVA